MFKDYIRSAVRGLRRHPTHAVINVGGLALGLAATFAILIFIAHETSYDRHHERADRIYRVAVNRVQPDGEIRSAATPRPLASALAEQLPEVERSARLSRERADQVLLRLGETSTFENRFFFADASVFEVFSIPLLRGNISTALAEPFTLVIAESAAQRLFGSNDPLGQSVSVRLRGDGDTFEYRVTGVVKDPPETSHFHFNFIASYEDHPNVGDADDQNNWAGLHLYTYVLLRPGSDASQITAKIPSIVRPKLAEQVEENLGITLRAFEAAGNRFDYFLQPLTDIHLHSNLQHEIEPNGAATYVYLFGIIAAFILALACINFTHLAMARSISRTKEVGVRKVMGARRSELVGQFLTEALLSAFMAKALAVGLLWIGAAFVEQVGAQRIDVAPLNSPLVIGSMVAATLVAALAAGIAPAIVITRYEPAAAVRGTRIPKGTSSIFRGGLVAFQFAVAGTLIVCTLVMERQMDFLHQAKLGFNEQHVVVVEGTEVLADRMHVLKQRVRSIEGVVDVTNAQSIPGRPLGEITVRNADAPADALVSASWMTVGASYAATLGVQVITGRDFSADFPTDSTAVLLNATAAAALGLTSSDIVGTRLVAENREYHVVGVVEDYHFESLHEPIGPLVIFGPDPWNRARPNLVMPVRVRPDGLGRTLAALEETWKEFAPGQPLTYSFLDEEFARLYRSEERIRGLFRVFSLLTIVIASLGLFGLTAFAAKRRVKEIGVRKVLGASIGSLLHTLSRGFVALVIIGLSAAMPIAYVAMDRWLATFSYRVQLGPSAFLLASAIVLLIALATIGFHVVRAALANPVDSLSYE